MSVRLVLCLFIGLLMSGCVSPAPIASEPTPLPAEEPRADTTRFIRLEHSGDAGDWLILWAPFAHHSNPYRQLGEVRFETADSGEPNLAFLSPLDSVGIHENTTHWGARLSEGMGVRASDYGITSHFRYQTTVHASNLSGLFAFYSANVPWTLHINITLEKAMIFTPRVLTGEGASFVYGGVQEHGIRLPVGEVELSTETSEPGWTHIEFLAKRIHPKSEREIEVRFADGFEIVDETSVSGSCLVLSCGAGTTGSGDQFGAINNTLGENLAWARYQEAGYGLDIAIVHLPGAESAFPAEFNVTQYARWGWPFTGLAPPP